QGLLARYRRLQEGEAQEPLRALQQEIDDYWQIMHTTYKWNKEERDQQRYAFFNEQLVPRRTTMLQIADQIGSINHQGLARAENRFTRSEGNLRWSLIGTFSLTLLGGTVLALMAAR